MRARPLIAVPLVLTIFFAICAKSVDNSQDKRNSKPKPQPSEYEQVQQQQHQQMCNILGHASNIFGNFVQLVSKPNDRENVGAQVGNMAQNIFHIVSEANSSPQRKSEQNQNEQDILAYLNSKQFKQDLENEILKQLDNL